MPICQGRPEGPCPDGINDDKEPNRSATESVSAAGTHRIITSTD